MRKAEEYIRVVSDGEPEFIAFICVYWVKATENPNATASRTEKSEIFPMFLSSPAAKTRDTRNAAKNASKFTKKERLPLELPTSLQKIALPEAEIVAIKRRK